MAEPVGQSDRSPDPFFSEGAAPPDLIDDLPTRQVSEVEVAARALLDEMDRLTWGVPPETDERRDLVWFSAPVWAATRRKAEVLRKAVG